MNECPSNNFIKGTPSGKCWGCGHYMCYQCVNLDKRITNYEVYHNLINNQGGLQISILK